MAQPLVEISGVRLTLKDTALDAQGAERVGRLLLTRLQELMEREQLHLGSDTELSQIAVPPVTAPGDGGDEDAFARAGAEGVYRALVQALG